MSRTVRQGDLAIIRIGNQDSTYKVTGVDSSTITAGPYQIVPVKNNWQLLNYNFPHSIRFKIGTPGDMPQNQVMTKTV